MSNEIRLLLVLGLVWLALAYCASEWLAGRIQAECRRVRPAATKLSGRVQDTFRHARDKGCFEVFGLNRNHA